MLFKNKSRVICLLLIFILLLGCQGAQKYPQINLDSMEKNLSINNEEKPNKPVLNLGMVVESDMDKNTLQKFTHQLGVLTDMDVRLTWRKSYSEINDLLALGSVDLALTTTTSYIWDKPNYHFESIAIAQYPKDDPLKSLIIVPRESRAKKLSDMKGKSFAMTDPLSNASGMYLYYLLRQDNQRPDTFFKKYYYTYNEQHTVQAVASGMVDGAAVKNHSLQKMSKDDSSILKNVKIINQSPPLEELNFVVQPSLDPNLKETFKNAIIKISEDRDKKLFDELKIEKFREVTSDDYKTSSLIVEKVMHR